MNRKILTFSLSAILLTGCNGNDLVKETNNAIELYKKGEFESACKSFLSLSEQGSARAKNNLAWDLTEPASVCKKYIGDELANSTIRHNRLIPKNEFKDGYFDSFEGIGVELYAQAAEQGYNESTNNLAEHYLGRTFKSPLKFDEDKAVSLLKKAAIQGNAQAALSVASMSMDVKERIKYNTMCAEQGYFKCMQNLVKIYLSNEDFKNTEKAKHWLQVMADQDKNIKVKNDAIRLLRRIG